jgi:hypothetical protein
MHYKVKATQDIFNSEPGLKGIPEFNACSNRELKFIFLVYDYEGPYRKLELPERLKNAAIAVGYKMEKEKNQFDKAGRDAITFRLVKMQKAREYFMNNIQANDLDLAMLEGYNTQLREYTNFLKKKEKKSSETSLAMKIQEKLPDLVEKRNKLAELVGHKEAFQDDMHIGTKNMSTLDKINSGLIEA